MSQTGRGGKRVGAGRKKGTGAFKEPTVVRRIPVSAIPTIERFLEQLKYVVSPSSDDFSQNSLPPSHFKYSFGIPVASDPVRAGYLTPAESSTDNFIDFNEYLSGNESNTIGVYAQGNSMVDAGIDEGDLLIIKTNTYPKEKDIVVAQVNEYFTVKRLHFNRDNIELIPENTLENYPVIRPNPNDEIKIVGIVTFVIKKLS